MKKIVISLFAVMASMNVMAQFPGGPGGPGGGRPGGPGGPGGDGPRSRPQQSQGIPGTQEANTPKGNGKITGVLRDSTSQQPVEYAAISLVNAKTNVPVDGTTSDDKGKFTLSKVAEGDFKLIISFIGYKTKEIPNVKIDKKTDLNLGTIDLSSDVVTLNEVQVVGMAQLVEEKVDRLVFNAEKDITSQGGDASDVMKKVPMLTVDLDGNVTLRGSSNVRVLINNKPSTIIAASVADALRQIPADLIKSIEVITSPSARYDAEGTAGIINIITKKSKVQGGTLNVNSGVGNRGSNFGLRGNYRSGKLGLNLGGFGRTNYNVPGRFENLQVGKLNDFTVRQSAETDNKMLFGNLSAGADYDLSETSSLSAGVRYGARNMRNTQDLNITNIMNGVTTNSFRDVSVKDLSGTWDVNVDYMKTLKRPSEELSVMTLWSRNNRTNDYVSKVYDSNIASDVSLVGSDINDNKSDNTEATLQVDYQTSLGKNQMFEVGGKGIMRQVYSNIVYSGLNTRPNNQLDYDQNVAAGYASYTFSTKDKWSIKLGARYEYTDIQANQLESTQPLDIPSYSNLVPSINLSKTFKKGQAVKLGYNRRLQRPGIQFLNPNVNASNPQNISYGNPNLKPELTDQFELGTSFFKNTLYVNVATFARFTNGSIESVRKLNAENPNIIETTYANIGSKQNYGVNIYGNITLFKIWQLGGGIDGYYANLKNNSNDIGTNSSNNGIVLSGRLRTGLTLKNGWGIQAGGFARGKEVQLQGTQAGFRMYDLGVKKDFKNKRGSIGIGMENFLASRMKMDTQLESAQFTQLNTMYMYNRGLRLNFNYQIGKMNFVEQKARKKKSVSNDDQKSNGGGTE